MCACVSMCVCACVNVCACVSINLFMCENMYVDIYMSCVPVLDVSRLSDVRVADGVVQ